MNSCIVVGLSFIYMDVFLLTVYCVGGVLLWVTSLVQCDSISLSENLCAW